MSHCKICGESLADDHKVLGQHLWEQHHITPSDYRIQYLGLPPKCLRSGCNNPVPRSTDGGWFKCCSAFCALEMGEDIPLAPVPSSSQIQQKDQETFDQAQVIMSARVCGPLFLLPLAYNLVSGAKIEWEWGLLWPMAGLAMVVWGYSSKLPKK